MPVGKIERVNFHHQTKIQFLNLHGHYLKIPSSMEKYFKRESDPSARLIGTFRPLHHEHAYNVDLAIISAFRLTVRLNARNEL